MLRKTSPARRLPALVLGTLLLASCGGGSGGGDKQAAAPPADALVQAAAAKSSGSGSSRISVLSTTRIGDQDVAFSGEGAFDYAKKTGQLAFSVPGPDGSAGTGGTIEQRIVGEALYLSLPQQKGVFYKLRVSDVAGTSLGSSTDPTASLQALQAVTTVEEVGKEQVRGQEVTHYRGEFDVSEAIDKAQGSVKTILSTGLRGATVEQVPFDAYLDDEGRLVKMSSRLELPPNARTGGKPLTSETTVELFDFGTTVAVEVPPAASVRDGAPLLAALKRTAPEGAGEPAAPAKPAPAKPAPAKPAPAKPAPAASSTP